MDSKKSKFLSDIQMAEEEDEDEYSASLSAIMHRRTSSKRHKRRSSSPFTPEADFSGQSTPRRRTSGTSSSDTMVSLDDPAITEDQIYENIHLHKEVISGVKFHPWSIRRKLRLIQQAKSYVKKHEGELQVRLKHSRSSRDILARWKILLQKRWQRTKRETVNWMTLLIPWELRIKEIESQFGSAVASYFTFLRWLFWVNLVISVVLTTFVILPEVFLIKHNDTGERKELLPNERQLTLDTILNFEGVLKYSPIFYGYYSHHEQGDGYRLPTAYFMAGMAVYAYSFVATLRKMAANFRQSKLSEKEDECIFTWKLFTAWDYMIGNTETAQNRTSSIILGFKEALLEEAEKMKTTQSWKIIAARIFINLNVFAMLAGSAVLVVQVVNRSSEPYEEEATSFITKWYRQNEVTLVMTVIGGIFPMIFEGFGFLERYHPRKTLRIQLARIMALNLLNLYALTFALFVQIGGMTAELKELKTNISLSSVAHLNSPVALGLQSNANWLGNEAIFDDFAHPNVNKMNTPHSQVTAKVAFVKKCVQIKVPCFLASSAVSQAILVPATSPYDTSTTTSTFATTMAAEIDEINESESYSETDIPMTTNQSDNESSMPDQLENDISATSQSDEDTVTVNQSQKELFLNKYRDFVDPAIPLEKHNPLASYPMYPQTDDSDIYDDDFDEAEFDDLPRKIAKRDDATLFPSFIKSATSELKNNETKVSEPIGKSTVDKPKSLFSTNTNSTPSVENAKNSKNELGGEISSTTADYITLLSHDKSTTTLTNQYNKNFHTSANFKVVEIATLATNSGLKNDIDTSKSKVNIQSATRSDSMSVEITRNIPSVNFATDIDTPTASNRDNTQSTTTSDSMSVEITRNIPSVNFATDIDAPTASNRDNTQSTTRSDSMSVEITRNIPSVNFATDIDAPTASNRDNTQSTTTSDSMSVEITRNIPSVNFTSDIDAPTASNRDNTQSTTTSDSMSVEKTTLPTRNIARNTIFNDTQSTPTIWNELTTSADSMPIERTAFKNENKNIAAISLANESVTNTTKKGVQPTTDNGLIVVIETDDYNSFESQIPDKKPTTTGLNFTSKKETTTENTKYTIITENAKDTITENANDTVTENAKDTTTQNAKDTITENAKDTTTENAKDTITENATHTTTENAKDTITENATHTTTENATHTTTENANDATTENANDIANANNPNFFIFTQHLNDSFVKNGKNKQLRNNFTEYLEECYAVKCVFVPNESEKNAAGETKNTLIHNEDMPSTTINYALTPGSALPQNGTSNTTPINVEESFNNLSVENMRPSTSPPLCSYDKANLNITDDLLKDLSLQTRYLDLATRQKLRKLCWETIFGQELVKLTVLDLGSIIFSTFFMDFLRALFVRYMNKCWCWDLEKEFPKYGDFKIAENILHLVNNQGMVWMGMFFSPGLALINVLKLIIMIYLRSWAVLTCNVPHEVVFRASRSNNFYLALLLTMLFLCVLPVGYAIVWLEPSWHCGPFSKDAKIIHVFTRSLRRVVPKSLHQTMDYIASAGTVIPLLLILLLVIYYLWSLTSALREANNDLKIQLTRERTEERRKMFKMANMQRQGENETDNTLAKWKKLLQDVPSAKLSAEDITPSCDVDYQGGDNTDSEKSLAEFPIVTQKCDDIKKEPDIRAFGENSESTDFGPKNLSSQTEDIAENKFRINIPRIKISRTQSVELISMGNIDKNIGRKPSIDIQDSKF